MMNADVQAVHDLQSCLVEFWNNRVIRVGSCMNNPQTIVIGVEINHVVFCGVKILSAVDVLYDFAYCQSLKLKIKSLKNQSKFHNQHEI